jgi:hypothetical protein
MHVFHIFCFIFSCILLLNAAILVKNVTAMKTMIIAVFIHIIENILQIFLCLNSLMNIIITKLNFEIFV